MKYALALAYRANRDTSKANEAYKKIMKDENTIRGFNDKLQTENRKLIESDLYGEVDIGLL